MENQPTEEEKEETLISEELIESEVEGILPIEKNLEEETLISEELINSEVEGVLSIEAASGEERGSEREGDSEEEIIRKLDYYIEIIKEGFVPNSEDTLKSTKNLICRILKNLNITLRRPRHIWEYPLPIRSRIAYLFEFISNYNNAINNYRVPYYYLSWNCAVSTLKMVLDSYKKNYAQRDLWEYFRSSERLIIEGAVPYEEIEFLRNNRFNALHVRIKSNVILRVLEAFWSRFQIIFQVRYQGDPHLGHATVLNKLENNAVYVHNPDYLCEGKNGPNERISISEILDLQEEREIYHDNIGNWITVIEPSITVSDNPVCNKCKLPYDRIYCENCKREVEILPYEILGCRCKKCVNCNWDEILCPVCKKNITSSQIRIIEHPDEETRTIYTDSINFPVRWVSCGTRENSVKISLFDKNNTFIKDQDTEIDPEKDIFFLPNDPELNPSIYCIQISSENYPPVSKKFYVLCRKCKNTGEVNGEVCPKCNGQIVNFNQVEGGYVPENGNR